MEMNLVTLLLKLPRNTDVTTEAAQTFLSTLTKINPDESTFIETLLGKNHAKPLALEIVHQNGQVHFQLTCHLDLVPFIETQIHSSYPLTVIEKIKDPLFDVDSSALHVAYLKLKEGDYYPLYNFKNFTDVDPLSTILSVLSKTSQEEFAIVQIALESAKSNWQFKGQQFSEYGDKKEDGSRSPRSDANVIREKIALPGFQTSIRIASGSAETLQAVINTFEVFNRSDGNSFSPRYPVNKKQIKEVEHLVSRTVADKQTLNIAEIATIWHLPSDKIKTPSIVWGTAVLSEPPNELPISTDASPAEKAKINFFAKTLYKNKETPFGIKDKDRLRHVWVVGKTGTGKSTMVANMAIDDLKKDRGLAVIDPHGDLCEDILDYIPSNRINDTIYFNPADRDFPIVLNPLEVTNREEAELVVAGLMSIFTKVWANVWSARMEYILRNSFLTLTEIPDATLADVLKLLSDQSYRNRVVARLQDQTLVHFWKNEFDAMPEKLQKEAISPIQNKVGQFVTSPMIRRIIGAPKSSISIDEIMNQKKILLVNLSQGRLGEDNAALLGAMLITKFQLAAMHRVDIPKDERVPFHLYVDEFQNFATSSFIKILSEARKYGLALLLANQYMAQIPEEIQKAILGNAGTMISFAVGADDARVIHKEFAEVFEENDLVNLENYQIAIKLMIDAHSTRPFVAKTLPLPENKNSNREKVIRVSRERWAKEIMDDNPESRNFQASTNDAQVTAKLPVGNTDSLTSGNPSTAPTPLTGVPVVPITQQTSDPVQSSSVSEQTTPPTQQSQTVAQNPEPATTSANTTPTASNTTDKDRGQESPKTQSYSKKKKKKKKNPPGTSSAPPTGEIYSGSSFGTAHPMPATHNPLPKTHNPSPTPLRQGYEGHAPSPQDYAGQAAQNPHLTTPNRSPTADDLLPTANAQHSRTIQGEKEQMGERGFEAGDMRPQKVRDPNETLQTTPPNNYPNARTLGNNTVNSNPALANDHPLMQPSPHQSQGSIMSIPNRLYSAKATQGTQPTARPQSPNLRSHNPSPSARSESRPNKSKSNNARNATQSQMNRNTNQPYARHNQPASRNQARSTQNAQPTASNRLPTANQYPPRPQMPPTQYPPRMTQNPSHSAEATRDKRPTANRPLPIAQYPHMPQMPPFPQSSTSNQLPTANQYPPMPQMPPFPQPTDLNRMPTNNQYPPPRPAFDMEKNKRDMEEKQKEDQTKLADLMSQLDDIKNESK